MENDKQVRSNVTAGQCQGGLCELHQSREKKVEGKWFSPKKGSRSGCLDKLSLFIWKNDDGHEFKLWQWTKRMKASTAFIGSSKVTKQSLKMSSGSNISKAVHQRDAQIFFLLDMSEDKWNPAPRCPVLSPSLCVTVCGQRTLLEQCYIRNQTTVLEHKILCKTSF